MKDTVSSQNSNVIVVGASGGMGSALVDKLLRQGETVVSFDIAEREGFTHSRLTHYTVDVTNEIMLEMAVKKVSKEQNIKSVIVCSGGALESEVDVRDITKLEKTVFVEALNVNLVSSFLIAKHFMPYLRATQGSLTFTGSINGHRGIGIFAYSAAKAGLEQLTRNLAAEEGKNGVRVNTVSLGTVITPRTRDLHSGTPEHFDKMTQTTLLGKTLTPEDVANVLYSVSLEFSGMTGQTVIIDSGQIVRW